MTFNCGLSSKISSTAISIVSCKDVLVKGLQTSYETHCISSQKLNESLAQCYFGITGSRSSVRNLSLNLSLHSSLNLSLKFEFFNCQHKNVKFTLEKESNKFLSFLDILIKNERNHFSTSVF